MSTPRRTMPPAVFATHALFGLSAILYLPGPPLAQEKTVDEVALAHAAPLPRLDASRLREERLTYRMTVSLGGAEMSVDASVEIAKEPRDDPTLGPGVVWRIENRAGPPVPFSDAFVLRAEDVALVERRMVRPTPDGQLSESLHFTAQSVRIGDQEFALERPVLADLDIAVLAMPLKEGYESYARTFLASPQVVHWKVAVSGTETVATPAGEFAAYRVSMTCLDMNALTGVAWVSKDAPYRVIRREGPFLPELGMGRMVSKLVAVGGP